MSIMKYFVYVLKDPRKNDKIFYVGKASWRFGRQYNEVLYRHLRDAEIGTRTYKCNVIRKILNSGLNVKFEVIKYFSSNSEALNYEAYYANNIGYENISNTAKCGLAEPDMQSEVTRKKLSRLMKKLWSNQEWKNKRSKELMGRKFCEEAKRNCSVNITNRYKDPNERNKISIAIKKFWNEAINNDEYLKWYRSRCSDAWKTRKNLGTYSEICKKISKSQFGRRPSEETRKKMSESAKRRCSNPEYRKELTSRWKNNTSFKDVA